MIRPDPKKDLSPKVASGNCEERLAKILSDCSDRLNTKGGFDRHLVVSQHPDLAPELEDMLDTLIECSPDDPDTEGRNVRVFSDYEIVCEIGRGGMGVVYEARQRSLERRVALKVLPPGFLGKPSAVERFLREAKAVGRLHHPHLVPVFDLGVEGGTPYLAMELVAGESLEQILVSRKGLDSPEGDVDLQYCLRVATAFVGAATAVEHANERGVIHRDLKPSNLILDEGGRLRVVDFGLAQLEGQDRLTGSGEFLGTPRYMSPEQAQGEAGIVDHRADVYGLGASLYEMLTLSPPHSGHDHRDLLTRIIHDLPVPLRRLQPRIPRDLETIVMKCLEKDPRNRYETAGELAKDLGRFLRGDVIRGKPPTASQKMGRWTRRHAPRLLLAICVAILVGVSGYFSWSSFSETRRRQLVEYEPAVQRAVSKMILARFMSGVDTARPTGIDSQGLFESADFNTIMNGSLDLVRESIGLLDDAIRELPDRPEAYYHRAYAHFLLSDRENVIRDLANVFRKNPGFVPARFLRARLLRSEGKTADADRELLETEALLTDPWTTAWLRAQVALFERRFEDAATELSRLIDLDATTGAGHYAGFSIDSLLLRGAARMEAQDYIGAIEDFASARVVLREVLPHGPIELFLAKAYYLSGNPLRTEKILLDLHRRTRFEDDVVIWASALYHRLRDLPRGLSWANRIEKEELRERHRSCFLTDLGRFEEALAAADRALVLGPKKALNYVTRGYCFYRWEGAGGLDRRLHDESTLMVKKALALDPENSYVRTAYGTFLVEDGHYDEAIVMLRSALKESPTIDFAHLMIARALEETGDVTGAINGYKKALECNRHSHLAMSRLGALLTRQGNLASAEQLFERTLELNPRDTRARLGLAFIWLSRGDVDEAVEKYAGRTDGDFVPTCLELGHSLEEDQHGQLALQVYEKAIEDDPQAPEPYNRVYGLMNTLGPRRLMTCDLIWVLREVLEKEELPRKIRQVAEVSLGLASK